MKNILIKYNKKFKSFDNMYYVSNDGEVYSTHSNKLLKHYIDHNGYHRVDIHGKHIKVHKLAYITWISEEIPSVIK